MAEGLIPAPPAPETIVAARSAAGLSQAAAGRLIGIDRRFSFSEWERGVYAMPAQTWALFLLATGQHPAYVLAPRPALPAVSTGTPET